MRRERYRIDCRERKPVVFAITGFNSRSRLYQNGEPFDEPKTSYIKRIIKKIMSKLRIKPANDHINCTTLINMLQRETVPVARSVDMSSAVMDKIPSESIGEKSTIPIRVNANRLNQLR